MNKARVEELIRELLIEIGEDPTREGLIDTLAASPSPMSSSQRAIHKISTN